MYIYIYMYICIDIYIFIGPPVYQCGEHWSGGPSSLLRGAKEKLSIPPIGCPQNLCAKFVRKILCAISDKTGKFVHSFQSEQCSDCLEYKYGIAQSLSSYARSLCFCIVVVGIASSAGSLWSRLGSRSALG